MSSEENNVEDQMEVEGETKNENGNNEAEANSSDEKTADEEATDSKKEESKPEKDVTAGAAAASNPHYRVKISGLPRFYTPTDPLLLEFKRLLASLHLNFKYIRSPKKGNSWLYITFYTQAHQEKALKLLKNYKWKGRTLICTLVVADVLKRKQEDCGQESSKRPKLDIPIEEQMLMSTIPYHTISYKEQLSKKNEEALCLFKWLSLCMEKKTPQLIGYIDQQIAINKQTQLPFKLAKVRASPVIDGYRNKCEFRIGLEPESKKVIVGYRVDNQEGDNIAVAPPDSLRHLPKEMLDVVKVFEKFVQESAHPPQITNHDTGVWRLLHVRINKTKQLMVVVMINPTVLDEEAINLLKQQLIEYFTTGPASTFNVVSLYLHTDNDVKTLGGGGDKLKRPQGKLELLWGQTHIEEELLDLKLEIDPNFYFQNNTWGAEVLYKAVKELAGVDKETTVLDLCCGSGGMGMMFAKECKEVIGIEVMDVNVDDAKRLAAKNDLSNCEFLQGAVDDLFPELEEKLKGKKVVPILDPPRVGISAKLICSLRKMQEAQRIIYVCSNHKLPSKNIMDLSLLEGENKEYAGTNPFFPTRVIPVDISPHSLRCELVILLERLDMKKVPKAKRFPHARNRNFYFQDDIKGGVFRNSRGSGHPPPLRGKLYRGGRRGQRSMPPPPLRPMRYPSWENSYERSAPGPMEFRRGPYGPPIPLDYDESDRYTGFRGDIEDALGSPFPISARTNVSKRLAMANAMLEQGIRLAEEAMAEENYGRHSGLPPQAPPPPEILPYPRRGGGYGPPTRNAGRGGPGGMWIGNRDNSYRDSWNGGDDGAYMPPWDAGQDNSLRTSWDGDNYNIAPSYQGSRKRGFGGAAKRGGYWGR